MRGQNAAGSLALPEVREEASGPIDLRHLGNQTLNDPGLELEVLRLFDDMSHAYYARLEASTSVPELLRNLHAIKGAAAGIGAFRLAELARTAESGLRDGRPVDPEWIEDINVAVEEVSSFIGQRLKAAA